MRQSDTNGMNSTNMAIVVAPVRFSRQPRSISWSDDAKKMQSLLRAREQRVEAAAEASKVVPAIVEALIVDCDAIFSM